jgi:hypothetical protein
MTDTPVTKLESVEKLAQQYNFNRISLRAALTEMWDLSRREALREVVGVLRPLFGKENPQQLAENFQELAPDSGLGNPARKYPLTTTDVAIVNAADFLERLAVEEGTR